LIHIPKLEQSNALRGLYLLLLGKLAKQKVGVCKIQFGLQRQVAGSGGLTPTGCCCWAYDRSKLIIPVVEATAPHECKC